MSNERRPRLDAILRAISDGKYDDELADIGEAIAARVEFRKNELLKMVEEVFGEGHKIVPEGKRLGGMAKDHLMEVKSSKPDWGPAVDSIMGSDSEEVISPEKPSDEPLTDEYESRSPQFGSIDENEQGGEAA